MNNCQFCKQPWKSFASLRQHEIRCNLNQDRIIIPTSSVPICNTPCPYCKKEFNIKHALSNHIRRCGDNPDRILEIKTDDGLQRLRNAGYRNNVWDEEKRKKHSQIMKKAVDSNPDSFTSSNRGRTKQIVYKDIKFHGNWELEFYKWTEQFNIPCVRNKLGFKYTWNGIRTYFPDFFLPTLNKYVEVKGYMTDRDKSKWEQFPYALLIIQKNQIEKIKNKTFIELTDDLMYVTNK